jgi:hypothetical protein
MGPDEADSGFPYYGILVVVVVVMVYFTTMCLWLYNLRG